MVQRTEVLRYLAAAAAVPSLITLAGRADAADDVTQARSVRAFDHVSVSGAFETTIDAGRSTTSVSVSGRPDAVARVTTEVRGRTLIVGTRDGSGDSMTVARLTIALPVLRAFENEGAGSITIRGLNGSTFAITNSGAAKIVASGRVTSEAITLNGVGKIDAAGVAARDATVDNNGVGEIIVRASGSLTLSVNGVGAIRYAGNPAHVDQEINGVGSIDRM